MRRPSVHAALLLLVAVGASACGGGSGGSPPRKSGNRGIDSSSFTISIRGEAAVRVSDPNAANPILDPVSGTTIVLPDGGRVTGPNGLSCGIVGTTLYNVCAAKFPYGTTGVALTATPDAGRGYQYFSFGGACGGTGACAIDVTSDRFVVVRFAKTQAGLGAHPNFSDPKIHGPQYLATLGGNPGAWICTSCHAPSFDGMGLAPSCNACHRAAGWADWQTSCSFCHGQRNATTMAGYDATVHPEYAAPPDDVAARLSGTSNGAAGAHQAHLGASAFTSGIACGECHVVPGSTAHVNGVDDVRFGPVATARGAAPTWTASTLGCAATYCHGNFRGGNGTGPIAWNATPTLSLIHI